MWHGVDGSHPLAVHPSASEASSGIRAVLRAIDAIVGVRVKRGSVQSVGERLAAMDNVAYVAYMTGGFDIFIEVFLADTEALFTFLNEDLAAIEEITDAEAWHVLRTEKFSYTWEGETFIAPPERQPSTGTRPDRPAPQRAGE